MHSTDPADTLADALQKLEEIWKDPRTKSFARRYAGDPDVADDALQSTYYAVARVNHLDQVENLWAYFCRVLIHEVHRERGQLRAALMEDFDRVAEDRHGTADFHRASPSRSKTRSASRCWAGLGSSGSPVSAMAYRPRYRPARTIPAATEL